MKIKAIRLSQVIAYRKDQSKLKYDRFLSSGKYLLSKQNDDERIERLILKARDFVNTDEEVFEGENDGQYYPEFYGGVVAVTNAVLKEIEATEDEESVINVLATSLGDLIGFFSIENETNGVKITSTSPPDGNNYTSGLTTDIAFNEIFINPNFNTKLIITTDIDSELQDQFMITDTIQINCPSSTSVLIDDKKTIGYFNLLGKNAKRKKYSFQLLNNQKKKIIYE